MRGPLEKIFSFQKIKTFKEPALVNAGSLILCLIQYYKLA